MVALPDVPRYATRRLLLRRGAHEFVNRTRVLKRLRPLSHGEEALAPSRTMRRRCASHPPRRGQPAALQDEGNELHHHAQPFCRTRNAGVEPPCAALLERKTLIEQHHVVPLRALRLVNREHIAVVELVIGLALLPRYRLDGAA